MAPSDPLALYQGLQEGDRFLLLAAGAHPENRTVLAWNVQTRIRVYPWGLDVDGERREGDPLSLLATHLAPRRDDGWFPLWVGSLHYEAVHLFEPTLPRPPDWGDASLGDFALCRHGAVWDGARLTHSEGPLPAPGVVPEPPSLSPTWTTSLDQATFEDTVGRLKRLIQAGDNFQVNLATRFATPAPECHGAAWLHRLREANPSPFMALLDWGDHTIVSGSPEQLFGVESGRIRARPIAGTRPRGPDEATDARMETELCTDAKEQAEHTMLVDLVRNDVARVARPGTVCVPESMSVERYRHVMHLVSRVESAIATRDPVEHLRALFPGGTITGAPKHRACLRIAESEPVPRGPYTGSAGFIRPDGSSSWNILIRTIVHRAGFVHVHAGSGIVADSQPRAEWLEAGRKADALLQTIAGPVTGGNQGRIGEVSRQGEWRPHLQSHESKARVLVIDNYDSFVYNLADYCSALGATVQVIRNDEDWRQAATQLDATHIILSPGPGHPDDAGCSAEVAANWKGPLLGVCLGHQAMALAAGGQIITVDPVHGKSSPLRTAPASPLADYDGALVARYHSLAVDASSLPSDWQPIAWHDNLLMAMQHRHRHQWGLQFHPESMATPNGIDIIRRFLAA